MHHYKIVLATVAVISVSFLTNAAPISSRQAKNRMPKHLSAKIENLKPLKFETSNHKDIDIYNIPEGGYVMVSRDSDLPPVMGMVDSGHFDLNEASPAMLDYIEALANSEYPQYAASDREPIEPLVKAKWNQLWPYNKFCPVKNGVQCPTGCVATSLAQIVRTTGGVRWAGVGKYTDNGQIRTLDYASLNPDIAIMPDIPDGSAGTDEIAKLMLAAGVASNMMYGTEESATTEPEALLGLLDNFGYDPDYTMIHWRYMFTPSEWEDLIYSEFLAGRPVFYGGQGNGTGHAFLCDGYNEYGLWHINWGWGGVSDGYFPLTGLNPSQLGIGGGNGTGYNNLQRIITIVPFDAPAKPNYKRILGSCKLNDDNSFSVMYRQTGSNSETVIYPAIAIIDDNDYSDTPEIAAVVPLRQLELSASSLKTTGWIESVDFKSLGLDPGVYRVCAAWRLSEEDPWRIAQAAQHDEDNYYEILTVTPENATISHPEKAYQAIVLAELEVTERCRETAYAPVRIVLANHNISYSGRYPLCIYDTNGNRIATYNLEISLPHGSFKEFSLSVPLTLENGSRIPAGDYIIAPEDRMSYGTPLKIEISIPGVLNGTDGLTVTNTDLLPDILYSGQKWPHTPKVNNTGGTRTEKIGVAFFSPTGEWIRQLGRTSFDLSSGAALCPLDFEVSGLEPGIYSVAYYCGGDLAPRKTIRIGDNVDGIYYAPVNENPACATLFSTEMTDYSGDIEVPQTITLANKKYTVTSIAPDAFRGAQHLTSLTLPETITHLGTNSLAHCTSLSYMRIQSPVITHSSNIATASGINPDLECYVRDSLHTGFSNPKVALGTVYTEITGLKTETDKVVIDGSNISECSVCVVPEPCSATINSSINIAIQDSSVVSAVAGFDPGKGWTLSFTPVSVGNTTVTLTHAQPWIDAKTLDVEVTPEAFSVIESIELQNTEPAYLYGIDGTLLSTEYHYDNRSSLPSGIYIVIANGKVPQKIFIK